MAFGTRSDEQGQQDEVLSKVDALLRRHRGGGLDAVLEVSDDADIPTLTEVLEEPKSPVDLPAEPAPAMIDRVEAEPSDAEPKPGAADTGEPPSSVVAEALPHPAAEGASATDAEPHARSAAASLAASWDQEWLALMRPGIERAVAEAIAAQMPRAIQEQVVPEVMLQLGDGLNRLRDAMRSTVRGVVQETIEQEVKRALKALLKERMKR